MAEGFGCSTLRGENYCRLKKACNRATLYPLYFCLAYQPVLKEIETEIVSKHTTNISRNRGVFRGGVAAYMDDVTLLVRSDQVDISIETARQILWQSLWLSMVAETRLIRVQQQHAELPILFGMPVGHDETERNLFFLQMKERIAQDLRALEGVDVGHFVNLICCGPASTLFLIFVL